MPAQIVNGLITFLTQQTNASVWDGEVPRYDVAIPPTPPPGRAALPITPETVSIPSDWPAIKVYMQEAGFTRSWNTEDPYSDDGEILVQVWSTTRQSEEGLMNTIEGLLASSANWQAISRLLGGPTDNPYYIIQILLKRWYSGQEEGVRTGLSSLLYRGDMHYDVMIHGAVSTY